MQITIKLTLKKKETQNGAECHFRVTLPVGTRFLALLKQGGQEGERGAGAPVYRRASRLLFSTVRVLVYKKCFRSEEQVVGGRSADRHDFLWTKGLTFWRC